jgi:hypothetical protein
MGLLERERHRLDARAEVFLGRETLDQADAYRIAGAEIPALEPEGEGPRAAVGVPPGGIAGGRA